MAKDNKNIDNSTICDQLFKKWLDQYPPEKTAALQDKYLSLEKSHRLISEKHTTLLTAKDKLSQLWQPLAQCIGGLQSAALARNEFIAAYGDLGVSPKTPYATIEEAIRTYGEELRAYGDAVEKTYFSNLEKLSHHIAYLAALKNLYQTLFKVIITIRDSYFKTEPDRRKPVIRELYRLFSEIDSNHAFFGVSPDITDSLFSTPIDRAEFQSLLAVRREAGNTAKVIKKAR